MTERANTGNGDEDDEELSSIPDEPDNVISSCNFGLETTDGDAAELIASIVQVLPSYLSCELLLPRPLISKRRVNDSNTCKFLQMMKASIL